MSPSTYRKVTITALVAICLIVVTGAAVRLSGSGLGCSDWPNCNDNKFIDVSTTHGAIEQINRLFTFVVAAAVVAAVLGAFKRRPRRRDLTRLSIVIALGIPMQGVVGAIVVLTHLNPFANQQHFLLSMVLVALGTVLVKRAGEAEDEFGTVVRTPAVSADTAKHVWAITILTGLALVSGTFVTGAGPHAGDTDAKRFDIAISTIARVHGITVMLTIGVAVALLWRLRTRSADRKVLDNALTTWMILAIAQAGVGYTQYFTGVPAVLVGIHVALATGLWLATVQLKLSTWSAATISLPTPQEDPSASYAPAG
ncbi:MAG: COX15/CtaA family protein [Ilumatobacteraceae bacterium]